MKKQLMTTTALVAASMLAASGAAMAQSKAAKPKLELGGWVEGIVGFADQDLTDNAGQGRVALDVQHDSEIHFKGSMTLDNGIRIRTRTELEGQSSNSSDQIDEAYIDISGKFGAVRIGSDDNAAHLMVTPFQGSWATNVGQNLNFDTADWIENPSGHAAANVNRLDLGDGDAEKITYFTPRIAGLQLGVSYMPSLVEGGNGTPELRTSAFHEGYAIAANYRRKLGNVGLGFGIGYAEARPNVAFHSDPKGWNLGGTVDVAGFRFAAGWISQKNQTANNAATDTSSDELSLGVRFKQGKNNFSVGYNHAEATASRSVAGDDETDRVLVSYRRDLGPGVQYRLNVFWADYEGENPGSADDNEGFAVTTSVRIAF